MLFEGWELLLAPTGGVPQIGAYQIFVMDKDSAEINFKKDLEAEGFDGEKKTTALNGKQSKTEC